jgi:hypothetical protein
MSFTPGLATDEMMDLAGLAKDQKPDALQVEFTIEPIENSEQTKKQGRPVSDYVEMITIRVPGEVDFRKEAVTEEHKRRFPRQYLAFHANESQEAASGTPISDWPQVSRAQVQEARHFGCVTVEQLAEATDAAMKALGPGWLTIRQKARDWLKSASDGSVLAKLRSELAERDARLETLEKMLTTQAQALKQSGVSPGAAPAGLTAEQVQEMISAAVRQASAPAQEEVPKRRGRRAA